MPLVATRSNAGVFGLGWGNKLADAGAMTAIASNTLGSDSASVTFSSIPGTYDDLLLVYYARSAAALSDAQLRVRFNSDTASNYSLTRLEGDGSAASSGRSTNQTSIFRLWVTGDSATANIFGAGNFHILNYANTSYNKTTLSRSGNDRNGGGYTDLTAGLWRSTSAISGIEITTTSGANIKTGSVFALYGIKKAA